MPDCVTFAACFVAKEVHQFSLSFPSQQLPLATLQLPAEAKCQWSGNIRHLWNLTPQRTHRMIFFLSQAQVLHISLAQEGTKVRTCNKVSVSIIFFLRILIQTFLPFSKSLDLNQECSAPRMILLRIHSNKRSASNHTVIHSWEETVIASVLKQTWGWYYGLLCLSPPKDEAWGWGGERKKNRSKNY